VAQVLLSRDPRRDIERIDGATTALVSRDPGLTPGPPGAATLIGDDPGAIRVTTRAESRQLLVLNEAHHPGWRALVDGQPRPVLRVDGDFLGCVLEPGRHDVSFRFAPRSHRLGVQLSAARPPADARLARGLARSGRPGTRVGEGETASARVRP
jgi:hypothetical protein